MSKFNLSDWALRHRSLVWYFVLAFMATGLGAYLQLGRERRSKLYDKDDGDRRTMARYMCGRDHSAELPTGSKRSSKAQIARLHQECHGRRPDNCIRLSPRQHQG